MTQTISRLFDNFNDAQRAVNELEAAGIASADISMIANNADGSRRDNTVDRDRDGTDDRAEGAGAGAGIGAAVGGTAGLLAGLGLMAIPGVGPVVAAGWLVATLAGAATGAAAGGLLGALTQAGVTEEDAHVYAEGVRRGGTLVTARVADRDVGRAEAILNRSAVNIGERRTAYQRSGWKTFDPDAPAYTAEQARRDRGLMP